MNTSPPRPALKPGSGLNSIPAYNFIFAEGGINLPPAQASIYAMIYQFSQNDAGCYFGSLTYTCGQCGITRRGAVKALHALLESGWIAEVGTHRRGDNRNTKKYMAVSDKATAALAAYDDYWLERDIAWEAYRNANLPDLTGAEIAPEPDPNTMENPNPSDGTPRKQGLAEHNAAFEQAIVENFPSDAEIAPEEEPSGEHSSLEGVPEADPSGERSSLDQGNTVPPTIKIILKNIKPTIQPTVADGSQNPSNASDPLDGQMDSEDERTKYTAEQLSHSFSALCDLSLNRNYLGNAEGLAKTETAYRKLVALGNSPEAILAAWQERLAQAERERREAKHFPQLKRWLESAAPDGAQSMCAALNGKHTDTSHKARLKLFNAMVNRDSVLHDLASHAIDAQNEFEKFEFGTKANVEALWAQAWLYFDEHDENDERKGE